MTHTKTYGFQFFNGINLSSILQFSFSHPLCLCSSVSVCLSVSLSLFCYSSLSLHSLYSYTTAKNLKCLQWILLLIISHAKTLYQRGLSRKHLHSLTSPHFSLFYSIYSSIYRSLFLAFLLLHTHVHIHTSTQIYTQPAVHILMKNLKPHARACHWHPSALDTPLTERLPWCIRFHPCVK